jgi:hypothetical protein
VVNVVGELAYVRGGEIVGRDSVAARGKLT